MKKYFNSLPQNLSAGLVVFLVAVPLCLGIALASGAPAFAGIIAGIVGGVLVGLLSGAQIGVSGPAAGLATIVMAAITDFNKIDPNLGFQYFLSTVVLMGGIQVLFGILRLGSISQYFPTAVIKGMLVAIGLLIILKQIPHAFGYDKDFEGDENFLQPNDKENTFSELWNMFNHITTNDLKFAIPISITCLLFLILWDRKFIQKTKLRYIPGPLIAVVIGIIFTVVFKKIGYQINPENLVDLGVTGKSINELFVFPNFDQIGTFLVWKVTIVLALVASLETLLSVDAADKLDPQKRLTPGNRELFAQGAGNIFSGMIGGLPVTQVVVRTSANVTANGSTKVSTIFHGILIALVALLLPEIFSYVPKATLAAILFMVGYKLAKPKQFKEMYHIGKRVFIPFVITIVAIIFTDLLIGILIGFVVSLILSKGLRLKNTFSFEVKENVAYLHIDNHISFLNKAKLYKEIAAYQTKGMQVEVHPNEKYIPFDIWEVLANYNIKIK